MNNYFKFPLDNYASCHECTNPDEIIFFGIAIGQARENPTAPSPLGGIATYSLVKNPPYMFEDTAVTQTVCSVPNPSVIDLRIPANCAIVIVVTELTNKGYTEDM